MSTKGKKVQLELPEDIHSEITELQEKLKKQGLNMSIANIIINYLELSKGKIKTGYEK